MIEPYTKKIIIVDESFMYDLESTSQTDYNQFNEEQLDTKIITLPLKKEHLPSLIGVTEPSNIKVGEILIKPDYSNRFINLASFAEDNTVRKYRLWTNLCVALGAKQVTITRVEDANVSTDDTDSTKFVASAGFKGHGGEIKVDSTDKSFSEDIKGKMMKMNITAQGSKANLDVARNFLNKYNLNNDDMFTSLFELREFNFNPINEHNFKLDFSRDIKQIFDSRFDAQLDVMLKVLSSKVELERVQSSIKNSKKAVKLSVQVIF